MERLELFASLARSLFEPHYSPLSHAQTVGPAELFSHLRTVVTLSG